MIESRFKRLLTDGNNELKIIIRSLILVGEKYYNSFKKSAASVQGRVVCRSFS